MKIIYYNEDRSERVVIEHDHDSQDPREGGCKFVPYDRFADRLKEAA